MPTQPYDHGSFCWVEIETRDAVAAKAFYAGLFGWETEDHPMGPDETYTLLRLEGNEVGGLYQLGAEQKARHIEPHWLSYLAVDNVDDSAAQVVELGGQTLMAPFDIPETGRMAVVQDPTGAVLALWRRDSPHYGATRLENAPGSACWNELATHDTQSAARFYAQLVGWTADEKFFGDLLYTTFRKDQVPVGGMWQLGSQWGEGSPHWRVYFAVADCDSTVEKATGLGAKILRPAATIAGVGRFAVIQDPQEAVFGVIKLTKAG